ncbi:CatB-related O-acetyltransferase [Aliikangiella sp. IMCC44653]
MVKYIISKVLKRLRIPSIKNSVICKTSTIEPGSLVVNSTVGKHSFCGYDCSLINTEIGAFCSIASDVSIGGASHPLHFVSTSPAFLSHKDSIKKKYSLFEYNPEIKTRIGSDVWIGERVIIKSGVKIGTGSVIGMGSVVTKDVPPYSICAGNPAKLIRMRFDSNIIDSLLDSLWWEWPDEKLLKYSDYFNDPTKFLSMYDEERK